MMFQRGHVITVLKEDNGTWVCSSFPSGEESLDWLTNPTPSDGWTSWPSQSVFHRRINAAINKNTKPITSAFKKDATPSHTGGRLFDLISLVGFALIDCGCCWAGDVLPGRGWRWPSGDFQSCKTDGRQPCVDPGAPRGQVCSAHSGVWRVEMLNMFLTPSFWLHNATEGLGMNLAGQKELVSEPERSQDWHKSG